jgi:hypothetical protein
VLHATDGKSWTRVQGIGTTVALHSISVGAHDLYIAGDNGIIVHGKR